MQMTHATGSHAQTAGYPSIGTSLKLKNALQTSSIVLQINGAKVCFMPCSALRTMTTTAIGGGMIRDVLLREMPFVLKKRVYAVAAILGALGYALLLRVGLGEVAAYGLGMLITTAVRMLATVFKWNLPKALE